MEKVFCATCNMLVPAENCLLIVLETDTGGTLVSCRLDKDRTGFTNRYHSLVDSGRYPNMSQPQVECKSCRYIRYREMEEEMEYWNRKNGTALWWE